MFAYMHKPWFRLTCSIMQDAAQASDRNRPTLLQQFSRWHRCRGCGLAGAAKLPACWSLRRLLHHLHQARTLFRGHGSQERLHLMHGVLCWLVPGRLLRVNIDNCYVPIVGCLHIMLMNAAMVPLKAMQQPWMACLEAATLHQVAQTVSSGAGLLHCTHASMEAWMAQSTYTSGQHTLLLIACIEFAGRGARVPEVLASSLATCERDIRELQCDA